MLCLLELLFERLLKPLLRVSALECLCGNFQKFTPSIHGARASLGLLVIDMAHAIGWNKNVPVTHAWTAFTHGPLPEPLLDYGSYFDQVAYQDIPCDEPEYRVIPAR